MEATTLTSVRTAVADGAFEQQPVSSGDVGREQDGPAAELRQLMDLADRYARRLVAATVAPPGVLLLVHGSDLEVVQLDGSDPDVRALPRLLARSRPSSAALVAAAEGSLDGEDGRIVFVVGESSDGLRDERRFRVRACGRTRRLTRLSDDDAARMPGVIPRLFPSWSAPLI